MTNKKHRLFNRIVAFVSVLSIAISGINVSPVKAQAEEQITGSDDKTSQAEDIYDTEIVYDNFTTEYEYTGNGVELEGISGRAVSGSAIEVSGSAIEVSGSAIDVSGSAVILEDIPVSGYEYYSAEDTKMEEPPIDAGNYKVVAIIGDGSKDGISYKGCKSKKIDFKIIQAKLNEITGLVCESFTYDGSTTPSPKADAIFGADEIVYTYSREENGEYEKTAPVNAGTYYVKAEVIGNANYVGADRIEKFVIDKAAYPAIEVIGGEVTGGAIEVTDETILGKSDGVITIYTDELVTGASVEYKAADSEEWKSIDIPDDKKTVEINGLEPGKYQIRYKEDTNHTCGEITEITIKAGRLLSLMFFLEKDDISAGNPKYEGKVSFNEDFDITTEIENYAEPKKEGYKFIGWQDLADEEMTYVDLIRGIIRDMALLAEWEANEYTVTYNANGGDTDKVPEADTVKYDEMYTVNTDVIPERTGYTFKGWSTDSTAKEPTYTSDNHEFQYKEDEDTTLFAVWEANEYTVTYDANGGDADKVPEAKTVKYDEMFQVNTDVILTRTGYTFKGWSTDSEAEEPTYTSDYHEFQYKSDKDMTLYAIWEANEYTVTYDANGGDAGTVPEAEKTEYDKEYTVNSKKPTRIGYTFKGWSTDNRAEEPTYTSDNNKFVYKTAGNTTLYAIWEANTYTVTYDANGGEADSAPKAENAKYDAEYTVNGGIPKRTGYTFIGWSEKMDGSAKVEKTFKYTKAEDMKLYAIWGAVVYNVTYNANGGEAGSVPDADKVAYDAEYTVRSKKPTRKGYEFQGWSIKQDGTSKIDDKFKYTEAGDITLYAIWSANTYNVTYDANGGEAASAPKAETVKYDSEYTVNGGVPTRTGYTFTGWSETADGTAKKEKFKYTKDGDMKLYAIWDANTYTVTYDANGGSTASAPAAENVKYDSEYTVTGGIPTKTGYTFVGWSADSKAENPTYTSDNNMFVYKTTADMVLYAIWSANTYTITYNSDGGTAIAPAKVTYDSDYTVAGAPERTGYEFITWQSGNESYTGGQRITPYKKTENITLRAIWKIRDVDMLEPPTSPSLSNGQVNLKWTASNPAPGQTYEITIDGKTMAGQPWSKTEKGVKSTSHTINSVPAGEYKVKVVAVNGNVRSPGKSGAVSVKLTLTVKGKINDGKKNNEKKYDLTAPLSKLSHTGFVKKYSEFVIDGYVFAGFFNGKEVEEEITNHTEVTIKWRSIATKLTKIKLSKGGKLTFTFNKKDYKNIDGIKISYSLNKKALKKKDKKKVQTIEKDIKKMKKTYVLKDIVKKLQNGGLYYFKIQFYYYKNKDKNKGKVYYKESGVTKSIRYYG